MDKRSFLLCLIIACLGFGIYANSLKNEFVWDDEVLVFKNPVIQGTGYVKEMILKGYLASSDIPRPNFSTRPAPGARFYRPLQPLSYLANYLIGGISPFHFRLTNILIHILNSLLVFFIITLLGGSRPAAFVSAILFCSHPAFVPSVSYISGRADCLSFFFSMLSYYLFLRYIFVKPKKTLIAISLFSFFCALLSKEMAIAVPILFILTQFYYADRVLIKPRRRIYIVLACLSIALAYLIIRYNCVGVAISGIIPSKFDLWERVLCSFRFFADYLGILLFPVNLHMERTFAVYSYVSPNFLFSYVLFAAFLWALNRAGRSPDKTAFFGGLWFLTGFFMISNIFIPLNAAVADHWLYLPSVGFFIFVIFGIKETLYQKGRLIETARIKPALIVSIALYVSFFSGITILRNFDFADNLALFKQISKYSRNPRTLRNLSGAYADKGDTAKAFGVLDDAIMVSPEIANYYLGRAALYRQTGNWQKAAEDLRAYLRLNPADIYVYSDLGNMYEMLGDADKAVFCWNKVIAFDPDFRYARTKIGYYKK